MHVLLRSWLDYKEYSYYYYTVIVIMIASLFDIALKNNIGILLKIIVEFVGIKYFVFNNNWNSTKNLPREVFLFLLLQIALMILNLIIPNWGYWNLIKKKTNSPVENKVHDVLGIIFKGNIEKYLVDKKTGEIDIPAMMKHILIFLYDFLKISVLSYPVSRYLIFTV